MKLSGTILATCFIVIAIAAGAYFLARDTQVAPTSPPGQHDMPGNGTVTIEGDYGCLPHRNTEGPQTMECALGLRTSTGTYYALSDTSADHSLISSVPTGSKVQVTGTLTLEESPVYQSSGTIAITAFKQL